MGVCASFFSRQDERCSSAFTSSGLHFGLSPGRLPLGHWQCLQQLLWRGLETTTTTGSTTKASAAKVPAATVPATASATVPAAPAAVPTTAAPPNHFWTDPRDNIQRGY